MVHYTKSCFFKKRNHETQSHVHFQDYHPDVIRYQYRDSVCDAHIHLIEIKTKKKIEVKKWKITKVDYE